MTKHGFVALVLIASFCWACEKNSTREPVFTGRTPDAGAPPDVGGSAFDGGDWGDTVLNDTDAPLAPQAFTKAALIKEVAGCAVDRYAKFNTSALTLQDAVAAYAATPSPETSAAAQLAWRTAMGIWQQAEAFAFGPASGATDPGGQGLRDQIYSFPFGSRCQVDVQIVNQAYAKSDFGNTFINARGLGALEYLLFHSGNANACPAASEINIKGTWAALTASDLHSRRRAYASAVTQALVQRGQALTSAWETGDFKQQLLSAGVSSTLFATDQAALNAIFNGLFYVEFALRDAKLGTPAGLTMDCLTGTCPEALESPYALESTMNIVNNIVGVRRVLLGCDTNGEAIGFDDWLVAANQPAVANQLRSALNTALALAAKLSPPLEVAITTAPEKVRELHAAVRELTTLLKTQFATVLNLDLPMSVEGDND